MTDTAMAQPGVPSEWWSQRVWRAFASLLAALTVFDLPGAAESADFVGGALLQPAAPLTIGPAALTGGAAPHCALGAFSISVAMTAWALARPLGFAVDIGLSLTGAFASGLLLRLWRML